MMEAAGAAPVPLSVEVTCSYIKVSDSTFIIIENELVKTIQNEKLW